MKENKAPLFKRNKNICYLRIIASFFVVMNHTLGSFCREIKLDSAEWWLSALLFILCKTAVPLFLMITGSLLLGEKARDYKKMMRYFLRILLVLIAWTYIYSCYFRNGLIPINRCLDLLSYFTTKPIITPLWYLYTLLGIYIMLPFFSKMISAFENRDYLIFLGLWCLFNGLIPEINALVGDKIRFVHYFQIPLFVGWVGYTILGYYILLKDRQLGPERKSQIRLLILGLAAGLLSLTIGLASIVVQRDLNVVDNSGYPIIVVLAALIFELSIRLDDRRQMKDDNKGTASPFLTIISEATFGIYLLHPLMINFISTRLPISSAVSLLIKSLPGILLFDVIVYVMCFAVVWVLKKIPVVRAVV